MSAESDIPISNDTAVLMQQVANEVVVLNEDTSEVNTALGLIIGRSSPLGVFAKSQFKSSGLAPDTFPAEVLPNHHRSIILGQIEVKGRQMYIDAKGIGYLGVTDGQSVVLSPGQLFGKGFNPRKGLFRYEESLRDLEMSRLYTGLGVRVVPGLAIIKLDEIILNGRKVSVGEAENLGIVSSDFTPVEGLRLFNTKDRVRDLIERKAGKILPVGDDERRKKKLDKAIQVVANEAGNDYLLLKKYLDWFAETLGESCGLIHQAGFSHERFFSHDLTLDCALVDLDGEAKLRTETQRLLDVKTAVSSLRVLGFAVDGDQKRMADVFQTGYKRITGKGRIAA